MLPKMRSDEKLPRGSFFYIQVGHRFYAGENLEIREVEITPERSYRNWDGYVRDARARRDRQKGSLADYRKSNWEKDAGIFKPAEVRKEFTGKSTPKLVDSKEEAKQYRKKDSALSACEKLKACYQGLDVKVTVKIEGETK